MFDTIFPFPMHIHHLCLPFTVTVKCITINKNTHTKSLQQIRAGKEHTTQTNKKAEELLLI